MDRYERRARRRAERDEELLEGFAAEPLTADALTAKDLGRLGELLACSYLEDNGYLFEERGYRCSAGEADLVMIDEDTEEVVLVEVKTRRARAAQVADLYPECAVDERKRARYARIAACYLMEHFPVFALRFDVVAVTICSGCEAAVEHIVGAFEWDGDR